MHAFYPILWMGESYRGCERGRSDKGERWGPQKEKDYGSVPIGTSVRESPDGRHVSKSVTPTARFKDRIVGFPRWRGSDASVRLFYAERPYI